MDMLVPVGHHPGLWTLQPLLLGWWQGFLLGIEGEACYGLCLGDPPEPCAVMGMGFYDWFTV